jgi:hypothetical protein
MPSDIKLDGEKLTLEGEVEIRPTNNQLKIYGYDLLLDFFERRLAGSNLTTDPYRRALVHGPGDTLFINYANDYKGGVVINGPVQLPNVKSIGGSPDINAGTMMKIRIDKHKDDYGFVGMVIGNWPVGIHSVSMLVDTLFFSNPRVEGNHIALNHTLDNKLVINPKGNYTGGVVVGGQNGVMIDLVATIVDLQKRVAKLEGVPAGRPPAGRKPPGNP